MVSRKKKKRGLGINKKSALKSSRDERVSEEVVKKYSKKLELVRKEISKAVIGQDDAVNRLISALLCNGHVLLQGVPGIAKTLLVRSLAEVTGSKAERIQFTVDLLPADITGITTYTPNKGFETIKGPLFANFVIADEINRSPPKTQSALLQAMQEKEVTIGKQTFKLPSPFFVMATQNPIESSGVYNLPEAQIDRFLFKLIMGYPKPFEEKTIIEENTTLRKFSDINFKAIVTPGEILKMQEEVKKVYASNKIKQYIVDIVQKTRDKNFKEGAFIEWGGSPRASISLYIAAKAQAFMNGRTYVTPKDVKDVAHDVLRHRIMLSYKAQSEGITPDIVIKKILEREVSVP